MHYLDPQGHHVEIDLTERGEFVLAGSEPRVLTPSEVVADYALADERRQGERRHHRVWTKIGRRRRDHTSAATDASMARTIKKLRESGSWKRTEAA